MTRPYLFLDVDGVINPLLGHQDPYEGDWGDFEGDWLELEGHEFYVRWSKNMGRALAALDVDIVWLTTWESMAPEALTSRLAVSTYPFISWRGRLKMSGWTGTKYHGLVDHMTEHGARDFIWVDDVESSPWRVKAIEEHFFDEVKGLSVCPDPDVGLTPKHFDQITHWVGNKGS